MNSFYIQENNITTLKVLKSAAGYYIGREYYEEVEEGRFVPIPYSRDSEYFSSAEEAEKEIDFLFNLV